MTNFSELGLGPAIVNSVTRLGITEPTPIQQKAIPLVLEGRDLIGLAQTGTGKTAAFGLPLIQHVSKETSRPEAKTVRALILAPTRELANQIAANLKSFCKGKRPRIVAVTGGMSINTQCRNLASGTDILVATPGRLLDLSKRKALRLDTVRFLVLDEADQMLDLGFIHTLRQIAKLLGEERQTLLFSATMPKQIEVLAETYLSNPERVQVTPPGKPATKIRQSVHFVHTRSKHHLLEKCLSARADDVSLVFARTKHGAEKLMKQLVAHGFKAGSVHGNKSQSQRDRAIKAFKKGEINVLVATDVAARGIDISGVTHVYNFNLPEVPENYVHRIGRTARAGAKGEAISFCAPEEMKLLKQIEKLMGVPVPVADNSEAGVDGSYDPLAIDPKDIDAAKPRRQRRGPPRGSKPAGPKPKRGEKRQEAKADSANKRRPRNRNADAEGKSGQQKPRRPGRNRSANRSGTAQPQKDKGRRGGKPAQLAS
ncbi:MAG: DEAD/DEAH box helicase [Pseudomonadota bacterium]